MAYDEHLATRFRTCLEGKAGISEKKMMGGVCFLHNGNMIGGASRAKTGEGRFMFRVGKYNTIAADALRTGTPAIMGTKHMRGFYHVSEEEGNEAVLRKWLALVMSFVGTLPAK